MYRSIILSSAVNDIKEAALWYNKKKEGLGKKFTAVIREKIHFIRKNPGACRIRYDNIRTAVLKVYPFMIHYYIDEINKRVVIIAVLHTSRLTP